MKSNKRPPPKPTTTTVQNVKAIVLKTCQYSTPLAGGQKKDMNAHQKLNFAMIYISGAKVT